MRLFFIICLAFLLAACGDPHETRVPADISQWRGSVKQSMQKLTPEERELFTQYVRRHTILPDEVGLHGDKADPIPEGMTIGKAIAEQRDYIAREQAKASGKKPLKN